MDLAKETSGYWEVPGSLKEALQKLYRYTCPVQPSSCSANARRLAVTTSGADGSFNATKAFVLSLSEALHEELKPHGIRVTCLCPGPTRTEFGEVANHLVFHHLLEIQD